MIQINRDRTDKDGHPIKPPDVWFESAEAATNLAIEENAGHQINGDIYADVSARAALEELFYGKCAYCEKKIVDDDWDVEHFRPKGRVAERRDHPGYYWLAYSWENLYPSCKHCNQRRKDKPIWGDLRYASTGGKLDQFPLEDEATRAMSPRDSITRELNLLIDPCKDNPEQYLTYDIFGQILAIKDNFRGQATMEVCHLKRRRLTILRKARMQIVICMLRLIRKAESLDIDKSADAKKFIQDNFLGDSCDFAGVARVVINDPDAFGV